jgi:predicted metal-binding membrane protein
MTSPIHLRHGREGLHDRAILVGSLGALSVVAWLSLWLWEGSVYAPYLGHTGGTAAPLVAEAVLFTIAWLLMIVAMMLPSTVPLALTFRALVGRRPHPGHLLAWLLVGYLAIWTAFGAAAWLADRGIHAVVEATPWLAAHPQLILGATLLIAGLWQFSPIRDRCLDACRSPLGFVVSRWRGESEQREALRIGLAHGAFCIGCCWSLMLVMFGVGLGSVVAMMVLGGLTAVERNLPMGRRLTRPVGVALVLAAVFATAS